MTRFSGGGGLVVPTGMNQYAQSFQQGMAQGQNALAKQQYAQKFKEITGVDSTGNEKLDAAIYQKTENERQYQQFAQNAPPGMVVSGRAGVGSYTDPNKESSLIKMMTFNQKQQNEKKADVQKAHDLTINRADNWAKSQIALIEKKYANPDDIAAKIEEINKVKDDVISKAATNLNNYYSGNATPENVLATYATLTPTIATIGVSPAPATTTQPTGAALTGGVPQAVKPTGAPKVGDIIKGHKYIGGNPGDPKSWQKM